MPLGFRSVVPYTVPGVLVLIGWWWYISRKKDRPIGHGDPESPITAGLRTSPADGSNGLVEKGSISPINERDGPLAVGNQRTQHDNISQIQDTRDEPSLDQIHEEAAIPLDRMRLDEVHKPVDSTSQLLCKDDGIQVLLKDLDSERISSASMVTKLDSVRDDASFSRGTVDQVLFTCQATTVSSSSPPTSHPSDVERPEPEGEVAASHSLNNTGEEMVICTLTPAKVQTVLPSETVSLESPPAVQDLHKHVLASTPTTLVLTSVQDSSTTALKPEDIGSSGEEKDLEVLAAGLVTEVISAATQEVLGAASCELTDNSQSSYSSRESLTSTRLCSQLESIKTTQKHHHLFPSPSQVGHDCKEEMEIEELQVQNGCSSDPVWEPVDRVHQTDCGHEDHRPTPSAQALSSQPALNIKETGDKAITLAEDSACSTCHSEDGISSEDLHSNMFDSQSDVVQVTDLSAREATQAQTPVEMNTERMVVAEEDLVDAVSSVKKLNGVGLRNGAHGTCEVETDQSGGSDVNSMDSMDSGCTMSAAESQSNHGASSSSEPIVWELEVPKHLVGRLIGKQGRYVSFLKQTSGSKIYISTLPYTQEFQICHIEGSQQQVDKALSLIGKKFKDLDLTNLYAPPPPPLTLPSLPMTSWLLLPSGVTVEVIVVNIVSAGHVFVQQHTHPTYHALRSLDQQMFLCYSQLGTPALPSPAEVGVICAAPAGEGAWWRAQVITFYKETNEVEIRYVDYGGYDRVKIDSLRQIRSDFVTLPFQGAEVLLDNIAPLPEEDSFSAAATSALEEMTRGVPLLAQVSNYDNNTGLPLVHLWNMVGDEVVSINRTLAERGLGVWMDGF
ncbi:A kinase (PRKA) anchor protein 1b [Pholidichthys leucotaenia]